MCARASMCMCMHVCGCVHMYRRSSGEAGRCGWDWVGVLRAGSWEAVSCHGAFSLLRLEELGGESGWGWAPATSQVTCRQAGEGL